MVFSASRPCAAVDVAITPTEVTALQLSTALHVALPASSLSFSAATCDDAGNATSPVYDVLNVTTVAPAYVVVSFVVSNRTGGDVQPVSNRSAAMARSVTVGNIAGVLLPLVATGVVHVDSLCDKTCQTCLDPLATSCVTCPEGAALGGDLSGSVPPPTFCLPNYLSFNMSGVVGHGGSETPSPSDPAASVTTPSAASSSSSGTAMVIAIVVVVAFVGGVVLVFKHRQGAAAARAKAVAAKANASANGNASVKDGYVGMADSVGIAAGHAAAPMAGRVAMQPPPPPPTNKKANWRVAPLQRTGDQVAQLETPLHSGPPAQVGSLRSSAFTPIPSDSASMDSRQQDTPLSEIASSCRQAHLPPSSVDLPDTTSASPHSRRSVEASAAAHWPSAAACDSDAVTTSVPVVKGEGHGSVVSAVGDVGVRRAADSIGVVGDVAVASESRRSRSHRRKKEGDEPRRQHSSKHAGAGKRRKHQSRSDGKKKVRETDGSPPVASASRVQPARVPDQVVDDAADRDVAPASQSSSTVDDTCQPDDGACDNASEQASAHASEHFENPAPEASLRSTLSRLRALARELTRRQSHRDVPAASDSESKQRATRPSSRGHRHDRNRSRTQSTSLPIHRAPATPTSASRWGVVDGGVRTAVPTRDTSASASWAFSSTGSGYGPRGGSGSGSGATWSSASGAAALATLDAQSLSGRVAGPGYDVARSEWGDQRPPMTAPQYSPTRQVVYSPERRFNHWQNRGVAPQEAGARVVGSGTSWTEPDLYAAAPPLAWYGSVGHAPSMVTAPSVRLESVGLPRAVVHAGPDWGDLGESDVEV